MKGQSRAELSEAVRAAETDAADAVEKDRIPRIYRRGVRNYFDRLDAKVGGEKSLKPEPKPTDTDSPSR